VLGGDVPGLVRRGDEARAEAIARKRPSPESVSACHAYLASRNGLVTITESKASHWSSGKSAIDATCWKPAHARAFDPHGILNPGKVLPPADR
jgi:FAD/FMN-containing dehydrogenase